MSKYLITGIAGFVGRYFWEHVKKVDLGCEVLGIDVLPNSPINDDSFTYIKSQLLDYTWVESTIKKFSPDYIIHLAAFSSVGQSWQIPEQCYQANVSMFLNIAEAVRRFNKNIRILAIGSSEEYGTAPFGTKITEEQILNPLSPYAVSKLSQEYLARMYVTGFGMNIVLTRSFNHIGPNQSTKFVVPSFIKQLTDIYLAPQKDSKIFVGNIDVVRDFMDVRDVVVAYYKILKKANSGEVYNVCSGEPRKIRDIIDTVNHLLNLEVEIVPDVARMRPNENKWIVGDNEKLVRELSWGVEYLFEDTICDIINSFLLKNENN